MFRFRSHLPRSRGEKSNRPISLCGLAVKLSSWVDGQDRSLDEDKTIPLSGLPVSRPLRRRCSISDVRQEKAATPREEEGRRRGTLAQGGGRGRVWGAARPREEKGRCRQRTDHWEEEGSVASGAAEQSGYMAATSSGRRMPPVPAPGRRGREGLYLTSCPRPLHGPDDRSSRG